MDKFQNKILSLVMTILLLAACLIVGRETAAYVSENGESAIQSVKQVEKPGGDGAVGAQNTLSYGSVMKNVAEGESGARINREMPCVVLDAGHGGDDPGKVGINGVDEKVLNLQVAELVKSFLEAGDVKVVMTRDSDAGLYDAGASNKKVQDMKRRVELIESTRPAAVVSIHQNSYPEEYVHGAQVFYYDESSRGKYLADCIQKRLICQVDPENTRQIKANDSYYLLKKTAVPIVIAECGFLSNYEEAQKLCDPLYQERVAWAIYIGIMQYLNTAD